MLISMSNDAKKTPRILVSNSYCVLKGFSSRIIDRIDEALTYENDVEQDLFQKYRLLKMAKNQNNMRMVYAMKAQIEALKDSQFVYWLDLDGKHPRFPTGHLTLVRKLLKERKVAHKLKDRRVKPDIFPIFRWYNQPFKPRYYQEEMVDAGEKATRGVFESGVGTGKTLVMVYLLKRIKVPTLLVVPSRALLEQGYRALVDAFGPHNVRKIDSQALKSKTALPPIRLTTIQTMASLNKRGTLGKLTEDIGMLLIDEFHHAGSKSYTDLLDSLDHIYYRFGFTSTYMRNDHKTLDMLGFLSNRIYHYPIKRATKEGYLTPTCLRVRKIQGKLSQDYQREYTLNYCGTGGILQAITDLVDDHIPQDEQVLILVDRKDKAGKIIHNYLTKHGFANTYVSGDNDKEYIVDAIQRFNDKKIRILIGSAVIGEGVDIQSTQHLILATGGKSIIKIVQAIGRCVRLHPGKLKSTVYDFQFEDTKYLEKHAAQRRSIFKEQFSDDVKFIS